jgi:TonB family protein
MKARVVCVFFFLLHHCLCAQIDCIKVRKPPETIVIESRSAIFIGNYSVFLATNVKFPEEAKKKGITGFVFASFVVLENGAVSDVKILRGIGYGCDEEVIRVIKLMSGMWKPAIENNKPVKSMLQLPIRFQL